MTTLISLNNQAFWTPPICHSAKPQQEHSSEHGQIQLNPSPSHDTIVISDEESDAGGDVADLADYLPSIPEIIARQKPGA